jgi:phage shock protein PspC (stress-responsive transcriptional regulator)
MDKTIAVSLGGQPRQYRLADDAYARLRRYLDGATARLQADPDRSEVLGDLERSVGDRLATLLGSDDRLVTAADIDGVLEAIGAVDTGHDPVAGPVDAPKRKRRLTRIREGQDIAGVCNGIAAYSEIDVGWVRTVFFLGALVTGGILGVVYIVLAFILPIESRRVDEPR